MYPCVCVKPLTDMHTFGKYVHLSPLLLVKAIGMHFHYIRIILELLSL